MPRVYILKFIVMIDKIKSALKTEYIGLGLSDKTIDRLASYVKGLVDKEEDIATAVKRDDVKLIATSIQGEIDGIRKAKQTAEEALEAYKKAHPDKTGSGSGEGEGEGNKGDDEPPKWFKDYLAAQKTERENADFVGAVKKRLESACKDAPILKQVLKGYSPKDGESEDDAVTRLTSEYNETVKEIRGEGYVPPLGSGGGENLESSETVERRKKLLESKGYIPKPNN